MHRLLGIALTVGWVLMPTIVTASELTPSASLSSELKSLGSGGAAPSGSVDSPPLSPVVPKPEATSVRPQEILDFGSPPLRTEGAIAPASTSAGRPIPASTSFNPHSNLNDRPGNVIDFGTPVVPIELPLRLEISLGQRRVTVYRGNSVVTSYPIAVGRRGWETPKGTFQVQQMFRDPIWISPLQNNVVIPGGDPDNPLGRHWIGFWTDGKNWIGFHGTPNHKSVGTAASHGCIRMYHQDVEELFNTVTLGTEVKVVE